MPKLLTTSDFISKSNNIHNNKYTYTEEYTNSQTKIKIICPIHGIFEKLPYPHIKGEGCPQCTYDKKRKNHKKFVIDSNKIHHNLYSYPEKYINDRTKISINCKIHGVFI